MSAVAGQKLNGRDHVFISVIVFRSYVSVSVGAVIEKKHIFLFKTPPLLCIWKQPVLPLLNVRLTSSIPSYGFVSGAEVTLCGLWLTL